MPMTVVVTRNVEMRVRGFLASCALEVSAGVYVSPRMNVAVRERLVEVLNRWNVGRSGDSVVLVWTSPASAGGVGLLMLGEPPVELVETGSVVLARRALTPDELRSLTIELETPPF